MTSYIGYQNLFESADSVSASNEATNYEGTNAYDWRTSTWWKPGVVSSPNIETLTATFSTTQTVDYFGVIGHNLGTEGVTIKLQYLTGSPETWTDLFSITPSDDKCIFRFDTTGASSTDWRVHLTGCTVSTVIGVAAFGQVLALPEGMRPGFKPPNFARDKDILNNISEGGQFLGRSILSNGYEFSIAQKDVSASWIDSNYDTLMDAIEVNPFFFSWDYESHQADAVYAWINGKIESPSRDALYGDFSFNCKGLIE